MNEARTTTAMPPRLVQTAHDLLGQAGDAWLAQIPDITQQCSKRWSCQFDAPYESLSINFVASGIRSDGMGVVLKICIPSPEYVTEADALAEYAGDGALQILERDDAHQAMLLERLTPGAALTATGDSDDAILITAGLMRRLWRPSRMPDRYPTVDTWMEHMATRSPGVLANGHAFPRSWIEKSLALYRELSQEKNHPLLLHGDLHMDNILSAQREPWLVIDPKGVIGPAIWETGPLLLNGWREDQSNEQNRVRLDRMITLLSEALGLETRRVAAWGQVRAVLSGWWTVEDHGRGWEDSIALAECLNSLM